MQRKTVSSIKLLKTLKYSGLLVVTAVVTAALAWVVMGIESPPPSQTAAIDRSCSVPSTSDESPTSHPGMAWVSGGGFTMGAEYAYLEEGPAFQTEVDGFWMDVNEVTNGQFAEFVSATGYLTLAERGTDDPQVPLEQQVPGSAVFTPFMENGEFNDPMQGWWGFIEGADWQHPTGPGSNIEGKDQHPVIHIAFEDALAYAEWKGHVLPTEAQFEYAAQSSSRRDSDGNYQSNTWQGFFPLEDNGADGFVGSSPVGCYTPNEYGLYDLIGNVWEWTASPFYDTHNFSARDQFPEGYDSKQPGEDVAVIKGGSFLCAPNYCMRYRPEARQGQSKGLGTSHIGFRTVLVAPGP